MTEHDSKTRAIEILETVRAAPLRALLDYWISIHPGHALPGRRDFDPIAVPAALGNLVLTQVERDPYRFRVRLMGTAVVAAMGADFTGRYLDEALPGVQDTLIHKDRVAVAESGLPSYHFGRSSTPFRLDFAPIERIYLPLAADGTTVDQILAMTIYAARSPDLRGTR